MVAYPVQVKRKDYCGRDQIKRQEAVWFNNDAAKLENYINAQIGSGKTGTFLYANVAPDVGLTIERVREVLFSLDGGYNGFTVASHRNIAAS